MSTFLLGPASLDVFPFNLPPGPGFFVYYLGAAAIGGIVTVWLRERVAEWLDERAAPPRVDPAEQAAQGAAYRSPASPRTGVGLGWLPRPEDRFLIAYLSRGENGVADALIGDALARGLVDELVDAFHQRVFDALFGRVFAPGQVFFDLLFTARLVFLGNIE